MMAGKDHVLYGELAVQAHGSLAVAMSVGSDPKSPSMRFKGRVPNEDALSARDDGRFARLVVADAHFGDQASALLVELLHNASVLEPAPPLDFMESVDDGSETTLTTLWLDRERRQAHVRWVGDSLALRLRPGCAPQLLLDADHYFITPDAFAWGETLIDIHAVEEGDVLVVFTDGVNECHYRQPDTSLTVDHIQAIFEEAPTVEVFVRLLGEAALDGVGGNPGGQDNIAIAAVRV